MLTAARGLAYIYSGGRPISQPEPDYNWFGQGDVLGVPTPIVILIIVAVGTQYFLSRRKTGRYVYSIGSNEEAVKLAGIDVKRVKLLIYTFSGLLAGLGGVIISGRIGSGNPTLGEGIELDAIAAAVIGGASLAGGVGTVWGAVVGAIDHRFDEHRARPPQRVAVLAAGRQGRHHRRRHHHRRAQEPK